MSYVEEFCEDIVIINHGESVLSGHLDDIKTEYGKGRKILSATNYELDDLKKICEEKFADKVTVLGSNKNHVILEMVEGVSQWDILEALKNAGVEVKTFGVYEPSLNDIFVSKVGEEEETEETKTEEAPAKKRGLFRKGAK